MHLFALVANATPRVHRISLGQDIQAQVEQVFKQQGTALLDGADRIDFDGRYLPESDEVLLIKNFNDQDALLAAGADPLHCPILKITEATLPNLIALFVVTEVDGEGSVCLQVFDRRRALTPAKFALISIGDGLQRLEQTGLILDTSVTAVLQGTDLLFKSFHSVSRLFDLTSYYHEATDQELVTFSGHESIAQTPALANFVDLSDTTRIRKQIALILDSKILDKVPTKKIVSRAKTLFKLKIATIIEDGKKKMVLPDNRSDLKDVLDFLQENFYKGCLTDTTFVSSSKRVKPQFQL
jgi:hypothetical protein